MQNNRITQSNHHDWSTLEERINAASLQVDMARVRAAYDCAVKAHDGQKRKDGSPYVTHCIAAAEIAVDMGLDEDSVVSALLHDTVEDTSMTSEDIRKQFGPAVAEIVEGVTKLTRVNFSSREDEQMENTRKMLIAMSRDIRVVLIKLADRLHNMRTMDYQTPEKQRIKSLETMQVYAPIAHRLGLQPIKWELEDLALKYLDPIGYQTIVSSIESRRALMEEFMERMSETIKKRLADNDIECTIYSRIKHVYSIYRKMYAQKLEMEEIFDICACRVIVNTLPDCYNVLGHVHDLFRPVPGRFKDYIGTPKPNGYKSVHTTVIGSEGIPFEIQIRTWDMHRTAEYGIAAHWKYKSGEAGVKEGDEEKFAWVRLLLEQQQSSEAGDFFGNMRVDLFDDEVFVFTPKGDVINLPSSATPIDFAYAIHSAVGNSLVGAKINGRMVPISTELKNGDIVEVITSKSSSGPSRDWLSIAKSGSTRAKIKQWFKKERRDENILQGRDMLDSELRRAGITMAEVQEAEILPPILKKLSLNSLDDLYAAVGYGGVTAVKTVNRIRDELAKANKANAAKTALDKLNEAAERRAEKETRIRAKPIQGVLIEGLDNCLIKFARCCMPVPGDEIVGFITRGYGVSIHRTDCPNHISARINPEEEGARWIDAAWADTITDTYVTTIKIEAKDQSGLVLDIAGVLSTLNAKVRSLNARDVGNGLAVVNVALEVRSLNELKTIMSRLTALRPVTAVTRANN